jgi:ABC-type dipeptide/oligopeptide/nickel transport system ATPase component
MRVFQGANQLLPWFTIEQNLDLVSTTCNYTNLVEQWGLEQHLLKYPYQLSVGQRQRFALIRAIFSGRKLLLCDEPLSGVDGITALRISSDFRRAVQDNQIKCMWITHNLVEAESIADQVILLDYERPELITHSITYHELYKKFS